MPVQKRSGNLLNSPRIYQIYMIRKHIFKITFLNEPELSFAYSKIVSNIFNMDNFFNINHLLISSKVVTSIAIQHKLFYSTLFIHLQTVKSFEYSYVIPIIQFTHTVKEFQVLLFSMDNSIQHYSFVCT